jgi:iron complex outermembrane receptor protein
VRTPSRAEDDVRVNTVVAPGVAAALFGDRGVESERLVAYELGYRVQPLENVSVDLTTFYNDYDRLETLEFVAPPPGFAFAQRAANRMEGETYGAELAVDWQPRHWWRWRSSYTFLQVQLHRDSSSNNPDAEAAEHRSPHHQFSVRSSVDLPWNLEFDLGLRYVDALSDLNVPSYFSLDARLAWKPMKDLEVAVVGQNLLDHSHPEFKPTTIRTLPVEAERTVFGKVTWKF